jgi:hypothetical protein
MHQAGLLAPLNPQGWTISWNVHRQANHHGHSAFTSLAPYVCSARPRTTTLDAMEFLRRFLQHVLPDSFMQVRHFGFLHASSAMYTDTLRQMIVHAQLIDGTPLRRVPPPPCVALCPTCGAPMRVVMRWWTAHKAFVETG